MEWIVLLTNAVRLWGFIAGVICITDVIEGDKKTRIVNPATTFFLAVFLIITGALVPLLVLMVPVNEVPMALLVLFLWVCISSAGWLKACAQRRPIMKYTAYLSLGATLLAASVIA